MIYTYMLIFSANFCYLCEAMANHEQILNKLEIVNELGLIVLLYCMLFFIQTNQLDALVVWDAGAGTIGVLGAMFVLNFGYMFTTSLRKMWKEGKIEFIKHQRKKAKRMKKYKKRVTRMAAPPQPIKVKKKKKDKKKKKEKESEEDHEEKEAKKQAKKDKKKKEKKNKYVFPPRP